LPSILLAAMLAVGMIGGASAQIDPPWTTVITVGGVPLMVEIADDPDERSQGLADRDGLAPGAGMLFVFPEPGPRSFWMKGMRFCLDIVWIEGGVIQGAAEGVCPEPAGTPDDSLVSYVSPVPVSYVLEVPAGWLSQYGFGVGTAVANLP
jgi:uncharacterized membrane protein (UPF0127 family)